MKYFVIIFLASSAIQAKEMYTTKWDNINVDEILKSDRLLQNYNRCLMDQSSCSPEGSELKRNLPDALKTECSKCSEKQKENTDKIIKFLIEQRPEMWGPLESKYDPQRSYYNKNYMNDPVELAPQTTVAPTDQISGA